MKRRSNPIQIDEAKRKAAAKLESLPDLSDPGLTSIRQLVFAIHEQIVGLRKRGQSWDRLAEFFVKEFGLRTTANSVRKYHSQETVRRRKALEIAARSPVMAPVGKTVSGPSILPATPTRSTPAACPPEGQSGRHAPAPMMPLQTPAGINTPVPARPPAASQPKSDDIADLIGEGGFSPPTPTVRKPENGR